MTDETTTPADEPRDESASAEGNSPAEKPGSAAPSDELVRIQEFDADGPLELDVSLTGGVVELVLERESGARVELRHDTGEQQPWVAGVNSLLSWVSDRFGDQLGVDPMTATPAEAVRQSRIEKLGNRLVVQAPKTWQMRNVPLSIVVHAPAGSHVEVRAGAADVKVAGTAGRTDVMTGSGEIKLDRADGKAIIRTGSGAITLGPTLSGLQLRSGSGNVEASSVTGAATLATGTGDVWLGAVSGEVMARTGSGDLSVADAGSGSLDLITGSGEVRIGIRGGVTAEVDLTSSSGKVSSELDVAGAAPEGGVNLRVRARTGSGDAVVTRAVSNGAR